MAHLGRVGAWLSYFIGNCEEAAKTYDFLLLSLEADSWALIHFFKGTAGTWGKLIGMFIQGVLALSPKLSYIIWRYGLSCFPVIIRWHTQKTIRWKNKGKARHNEEEMRKWSWELECGEKAQVSLSTWESQVIHCQQRPHLEKSSWGWVQQCLTFWNLLAIAHLKNL